MSSALLINPSALEAGLEAAFQARSQVTGPQEAAFERFAKLGFPNRRVEGWKWSDFNAALRMPSPLEALDGHGAIEPSAFAGLNALELVIVNGRIEVPNEKIEGVEFGIVDAVATVPELDAHPMIALNVAMTRKALGVQINDGVQFERPILIRHIVSGAAPAFSQTLFRVGLGASCNLIETFEGAGAPLYSHVCHMVVRDGGIFNRHAVQATDENAVVHSVCAAKIEEQAVFNQTCLSTGSKLSRHETILHFWNEGSSANLNSAALLGDKRHSDFTSTVLFKAENCQTRQIHKGVARDQGRNVFQGKFHVERGAQQTDAKMTANALLLSDRAEANHKPELEIYADDVECAHGSTAGALDENALFYMRQRGLDEHQARALLIEAFVGDVIDAVAHDGVGDVLRSAVNEWLEAGQ